MSEIFAAQAAKKAKAQEQANDGPAPIAAELQPFWQAMLQRVQQDMGNSTYIPLLSGQPRRENDVLVVRLTGPFAHIGKMLEKHRDQLQTIASEVAGEQLGFRFELDASAPAPAVAGVAQRSGGMGAGGSAGPAGTGGAGGPATNSPTQQSTIASAPMRDGIPITPELRQELEKDPLIRSLLVEFNGTIVKVEQK